MEQYYLKHMKWKLECCRTADKREVSSPDQRVLSRWAAADFISPQAMRLEILGLPCFAAEKLQRLDREPYLIDAFLFFRQFLNIGTCFFLNLDRISTGLPAPMKYGDLSTQSPDEHMLNCFLNQDYTGKG